MATFSPDDTFRILGKACARVGLDPSDAHLLRLGENAIYGLPSAGVVVRIARSMAVLDDVRKEVGVARWLEEVEYPAARLAAVDDVEQPIVVDGHPVTLWRFIETVEPRPGAADLGALLRRLHDLDVPSWLHLPPFRPFGRVAERLAAAPPSAPATDVEFLRRRFDELHGEYERIAFVFPPGPVHGMLTRAT